jgi:hypothetical protein
MLTDSILNNQGPFPKEGKYGVPLAWIIGDDVLHTLSLQEENADIFLNYDGIEDITSEYESSDNIYIKFLKNNIEIQRLQTSEYFGSILLSNPKVINLFNHKKGWAIKAPAKFINDEFVITDGRDNNLVQDWMAGRSLDSCPGAFCGCNK